MVACGGELIGEEVMVEEVLVPKAIAIGSSLEWAVDVATGTVVLRGDSDRNGSG
jgi:hypothetical protein